MSHEHGDTARAGAFHGVVTHRPDPPRMRRVELIYFNAGGGHRAAAHALRDVIGQQQRPWELRLVNLFDVLDPAHTFQRWTGSRPEDVYNMRLARGWTRGLETELRLLQRGIRLSHHWMVRRLARHWTSTQPALVVSLIPNFNRAMHDALALAAPAAPYATVMTDLADTPPHFWIEPGTSQHVVCGTDEAVRQARAAGVPVQRIWLTSGMILRPAFHALPPLDRRALRHALGLDPDLRTGVVLFGGQGSTQMLDISRHLDDVQLILLCGHNRALAEALRAQRHRAARAVVGFTDDVPRLMRLGDFFIGKPGPGSLSEAVHLGLPILTFDNPATMPQERYNVRWLREQGLGQAVRHTRDLRQALEELLSGPRSGAADPAAPANRAVFEVVDILDELMRWAQPRPAGSLVDGSRSGLPVARAADASSLGWAASH